MDKQKELPLLPESVNSTDSASPQGRCTRALDPHQLIQDRIYYHNKTKNALWALYHALPRELPYDAANALAQVLLDAKPRY